MTATTFIPRVAGRGLAAMALAFLVFILGTAPASAASFSSRLWPSMKLNRSLERIPPEIAGPFKKKADDYTRQKPKPVKTIRGAGTTDPNDKKVRASRRFFADSERAAHLALAWHLWSEPTHLKQAKKLLTKAAKKNRPTGHPIDETRLQGFIIAFDLVRDRLSEDEYAAVVRWMSVMREKKLKWSFGPTSIDNNHRTHHLLLLLMLDRMLERKSSYKKRLDETARHARVNIDITTGETLDYRQRKALYYQAYDLEAWLEIALLTGRFKIRVGRAYEFLAARLQADDRHSEFVGTTVELDKIRGRKGYGYGVGHPTFDLNDAARSVIVYYTINHRRPDPWAWSLARKSTSRPELFYLMRRELWKGTRRR